MEKQHIKLSESDRNYLEDLVKKGSLRVRTYRRALSLLELDRGKTFGDVSQTVGVSYQTVLIWRNNYLATGLSFLEDKARCGRPVGLSGEDRAKITALACSEAPQGHARWSLRLLADKAVELGYVEHLSHTHAGRILKKTNFNHT